MSGKRPNKTVYRPTKRPKGNSLKPGLKGFLISSLNPSKEKKAVQEAYDIFEEFDDYKAPLSPAPTGDESVSIQDELANELAAITKKDKPAKRFQQVSVDCKGLIFITCPDEVDPVEMAAKIFTSAQATSSSKARFIQRIIPVVLVCPAKMESLIESLQVLIPTSNLSKVSSAAKFSLQLRRRMNDKFLRDDITPAVVDFVTKDSPHKLDYSEFDYAVVVEVVKHLCCLSVLPKWKEFKKYNIQQVCLADQTTTADST